MKMNGFKKNKGILLLMAICVSAFANTGYIKGKAIFAQYLLVEAWQETKLNGQASKPWPWADTFPVAELRVPQYDIEHIVLSGASGRNLAFGPGHLLSSSPLTQSGHIIIGGHRDTHFAFLQHLKIGDTILLENKEGLIQTYQVDSITIHDIRKDRIQDFNTSAISLVTCYPFNSTEVGGPLRYIVNAFPV